MKRDAIIICVEPENSRSYKLVCAASKDSCQPAHPRSLIRAFAGRSMGGQGPNDFSYGLQKL